MEHLTTRKNQTTTDKGEEKWHTERLKYKEKDNVEAVMSKTAWDLHLKCMHWLTEAIREATFKSIFA